MDEPISFLEDVLDTRESSVQPWRILVVDDDGEVHQATRFALSGVEIMDRPLAMIHAYSGAEAEQLLRQMPDIAVILLDVVMETDDSGLCLIDLVRDGLSYQPLRIILRTGQPGLAPEAALVARYDIHDYMLKTDVSRERLLTSLTTAVRTFEQLKQMAQMKQQMAGMMQAVAVSLAISTPAEFAQIVMQQLVALYGVSPLVAVWHQGQDSLDHAVVVGANLAHQDWQDKRLSDLPDEPLIGYVQHVLGNTDDETTFSDVLILNGDQWRLLVVMQESDVEQQMVSESWAMFQSLMTSCANHRLRA